MSFLLLKFLKGNLNNLNNLTILTEQCLSICVGGWDIFHHDGVANFQKDDRKKRKDVNELKERIWGKFMTHLSTIQISSF